MTPTGAMSTSETIAILPAAGGSRRMGKPKLLLPLDGGPLVARLVNALLGGGVGEIVLVTAPNGLDLQGWARRAGITSQTGTEVRHGD